jgi:phage-related protein
MTDEPSFKPVVWVGSSRKDLRDSPTWGRITWAMRCMSRSKAASIGIRKTTSGFGGAGVVEIVEDHRGDTFRAGYTLRSQGAVYVLHAFQKKSKTGRETPRRDMELIKQRLREAKRIAGGEKP